MAKENNSIPTDLFSFFEFEKIAVFSMPADAWLTMKLEYENYAFTIKIKANDSDFMYELWGGYDCVTPLLEAVTDLLPVVGDYDKYFHHLRTYSRCIHDDNDGNDFYYWDFKRIRESVIQIIVRKNPDKEYEEELRDFEFQYNSDYEEPDATRLNKELLMAFTMPINHFAYKLKVAVDELVKQVPLSVYEEELGYPFPQMLYDKLVAYCNYKPYGYPCDAMSWHFAHVGVLANVHQLAQASRLCLAKGITDIG